MHCTFQNSSNTIKFVEYKDGNTSWSSPASVSTATSHLLPTVELYDGSVHEAHAVQEISGCYVKGSEKVVLLGVLQAITTKPLCLPLVMLKLFVIIVQL